MTTNIKTSFARRESGVRREYFTLCSFEEQNSSLAEVAGELDCSEEQALEYLKQGTIEVLYSDCLEVEAWTIR